MADNPYEILGVSPTATAAEIQKAYRALAKQLHPDLNPGDKAAEERFKQVSAAFGIVGDSDKRARFDKGEIDASGQERPEQHFYREYAGQDDGFRYHSTSGYGDFEDLSDLFARQFTGAREGGARFAMRGGDLHYALEVDFLEAAAGARKRITLPDGGTLDLTVPEGLEDGQVLRLKGKGARGFGDGPPGDALVQVTVRPHPSFEREGDDIKLRLPITIDEAVLGARVEVPTISGRVALTVPKGSSGGRTLRLKGKGIKNARTGKTGDQMVELRIVLPDVIDPELESAMEAWRTEHAYDPGRRF